MTRPPRPASRSAAAIALLFALAACAHQKAEKPREPGDAARTATETPSPFFELDAKPLCFAGANNYYLAHATPARVDDVLDQAQALGLDVLRVFAHLERGSLDGSVPAIDGDGTRAAVYFQYWDPSTAQAFRSDTRACALADGTRTGLGTPLVHARKAPRAGEHQAGR